MAATDTVHEMIASPCFPCTLYPNNGLGKRKASKQADFYVHRDAIAAQLNQLHTLL
jgi:hypothetical protein